MDGAEEDIGFGERKGDRAGDEGEKEEDGIDGIDAEDELSVGVEGDGDDEGDGEADGGEHRAEEDIDRALELIGEGGANSGERFWGEDEDGHEETAEGGGGTEFDDHGIDGGSGLFGEQNEGDAVDGEHRGVIGGGVWRVVFGMMVGGGEVVVADHKEAPMSAILDE